MSDEARLILGGDKDEIIRRLYSEANVTLHGLDVMREQLRAARRDLAAALVVVRAARIARVREWQVKRANRFLSRFASVDERSLSAWRKALAADDAEIDARDAFTSTLAAYVKGEGEMSDNAADRDRCVYCGLPLLDGEDVCHPAVPPYGMAHERRFVCVKRLLRALDYERQQRGSDRDAARSVVRAARVERVRYWQLRRARRRATGRGYEDARRDARLALLAADRAAWDAWQDARNAHRVALAAYVRGEGR